MIEKWRQCVTCFGYAAAGGLEAYLAVGPLRGGGQLREVVLVPGAGATKLIDVGLVLTASPSRTRDNFQSGTSLINFSDRMNVAGRPSIYMRVTFYHYAEWWFRLAVRVDTGAQYVLVGWTRDATVPTWVTATATVMGLARMGANGLGVDDGLDL